MSNFNFFHIRQFFKPNRLWRLHSLGPDELKDTNLEIIACVKNFMQMQFLVKLHVHALLHAIIFVIQFCHYGCLSTRLDIRNTDSQVNLA